LPDPDLALLLAAAEAAGAIALRHFGNAPEVWDKGQGAGPVSAADLEVDRMLRAELGAARPDYGWLSEESADGPERLAAERVFVVDPIDGTRAFLKGESGFAHSLAVVERGRVVAGVVHMPKLARTYAAAAGAGATANGAAIRVAERTELAAATVLANAATFAPEHWPGGVPRIDRHFRTSLAYRICLAAEGRFDAMLTLRDAWEWDVAAGDLIAREAGATVTTRTGAPPRYNNPRPQVAGFVVAAAPLHAAILAPRRAGHAARGVTRSGPASRQATGSRPSTSTARASRGARPPLASVTRAPSRSPASIKGARICPWPAGR
jgi:myo-inositol-1(or 4)-monophosphatase